MAPLSVLALSSYQLNAQTLHGRKTVNSIRGLVGVRRSAVHVTIRVVTGRLLLTEAPG
jgi:hypothetical protein